MSVLQSIAGLNWLSKALLLPKGRKLQFIESFSSFPKGIHKEKQIQSFSGSIVTFSALRAAGSGARRQVSNIHLNFTEYTTSI